MNKSISYILIENESLGPLSGYLSSDISGKKLTGCNQKWKSCVLTKTTGCLFNRQCSKLGAFTLAAKDQHAVLLYIYEPSLLRKAPYWGESHCCHGILKAKMHGPVPFDVAG